MRRLGFCSATLLTLCLAAGPAAANEKLCAPRVLPASKNPAVWLKQRVAGVTIERRIQLPGGESMQRKDYYRYQGGKLTRRAVQVERTLSDGRKVKAFHSVVPEAKRAASSTVDALGDGGPWKTIKQMVGLLRGADVASTTTTLPDGKVVERTRLGLSDDVYKTSKTTTPAGKVIKESLADSERTFRQRKALRAWIYTGTSGKAGGAAR